ncbi:MAG: HlyD family efflux transporter periplasmic adaptor subunit [Cytophagales bacterium]|nr:HlyD family efflux transporter periplasmic adaptor subunit [Cytophagales bacterium]
MSKQGEMHSMKELELDRLYSIKLVNSSKKDRLLAKWLGGIFVAVVLSMFLPWQQNIDGKGMVTALSPKDRPQTVQTLIAGRIEKWYVAEGQYVTQGDTILKISEIKDKFFDPELLARMNNQISAKKNSIIAKQEKVKALQNQLNALRNGLQYSISKAKNKVQSNQLYVSIDSAEYIAARVDKEIAQKQLERQQKLFDQGLVSLTQLEQRSLKYQQANAKYISSYNKYYSSINDLTNANIELDAIVAEYSEKISKTNSEIDATLADLYDAEGSLAKLNIETSNLIIRNNLYIIRAPQSGYIVRALKQGIGETVKDGEEIASIIPNTYNPAVELYLKPVDLPLALIGSKVRLQFDGWPAIIFAGWPGASVGTFGGKIAVVDKLISHNGKFRVLIVPDPDDEPWPEMVRMGTGAVGWAMLHTVFLGYEMWRQFNGFPPEFVAEVQKKQKKAEKSILKLDKGDKTDDE